MKNWAMACVAGLAAAGWAAGQAEQKPVFKQPTARSEATLYATGEKKAFETETVWRYMCGSDGAGKTADDLAAIAASHQADFADASRVRVVDRGTDGGFNVVFVLGASVPAAAVQSFERAEAYIEGRFTDNSTVTVSVSFASLGGSVIGSTGSSYVNGVTWADSRNGLINGKDADDTIQDWLPTGSTIPVRYVGNSAAVTNETRVFWTRANFRAAVGAVAGTDATMQYNSDFTFDFDPSDGVVGLSLTDTIVHEVGHAMGFTSGADFRTNDMEALDIFRFANNDGAGTDWNPDTVEEFQTTARCVDFNLPDDDVNSDIIIREWRMSDGSPRQASHFREGVDGIMDPTLSSGQTFYPNFFRTSDMDMFDAIGYDFVTICMAIVGQPLPQTVLEGQQATFHVSVNGQAPFGFQWRRNGVAVVNGGRISGATSSQLIINNVMESDEGVYDVVVNNSCDTQTSNGASLTVNQPCVGDANGDGLVNFQDLNIVLAQFGLTGGGLEGDLNGDGTVNFTDLNIVLAFFGSVC